MSTSCDGDDVIVNIFFAVLMVLIIGGIIFWSGMIFGGLNEYYEDRCVKCSTQIISKTGTTITKNMQEICGNYAKVNKYIQDNTYAVDSVTTKTTCK